uniref:Uncharacterized protein n=1 Tax=Setaria viridis TaxID=4556 RepID=A0A4V6D902_SETVI|nr:hypothetical protein SEVIR_3G023050v2 [Setaria viridis]
MPAAEDGRGSTYAHRRMSCCANCHPRTHHPTGAAAAEPAPAESTRPRPWRRTAGRGAVEGKAGARDRLPALLAELRLSWASPRPASRAPSATVALEL